MCNFHLRGMQSINSDYQTYIQKFYTALEDHRRQIVVLSSLLVLDKENLSFCAWRYIDRLTKSIEFITQLTQELELPSCPRMGLKSMSLSEAVTSLDQMKLFLLAW